MGGGEGGRKVAAVSTDDSIQLLLHVEGHDAEVDFRFDAEHGWVDVLSVVDVDTSEAVALTAAQLGVLEERLRGIAARL